MEFEYKFVRLGDGLTKVRRKARKTYQEIVEEHAAEGWRLVQIFAPSVGRVGAAKYYEIILERPRMTEDPVEARLRTLEKIVTNPKFQLDQELSDL